jgi:hypothetical protein
MSYYSAEYHTMMMSPAPAGVHSAPVWVKSASTDQAASDQASTQPAQPKESFLHHLWDVVNPLQHLPIIGTIYRAVTGEKLDAVEKIAGDTLYGGLWGAVSSVADVAFEGLTGKSFEDTALALFKSDDKTRVASTKVVAPTISANPTLPSADLPSLPSLTVTAANQPAPNGIDVTALTGALSAKGVDSDIASRALYAYRRSMGINAPVPVLAGAY